MRIGLHLVSFDFPGGPAAVGPAVAEVGRAVEEAGFDNLSEKWEGLALLPALDPTRPNDYFLFVANDNDFATTDGYQVGAAYNDGKNLDTMFLAYRVTITAVPEPTTAALWLLGALALGVVARRRAAPRT